MVFHINIFLKFVVQACSAFCNQFSLFCFYFCIPPSSPGSRKASCTFPTSRGPFEEHWAVSSPDLHRCCSLACRQREAFDIFEIFGNFSFGQFYIQTPDAAVPVPSSLQSPASLLAPEISHPLGGLCTPRTNT